MCAKIAPSKLYPWKSQYLKRNGLQSIIRPYNSNKEGFFKEPNKSLSNTGAKYENVFVFQDINIGISCHKKGFEKLTHRILYHSQILYRELHM